MDDLNEIQVADLLTRVILKAILDVLRDYTVEHRRRDAVGITVTDITIVKKQGVSKYDRKE